MPLYPSAVWAPNESAPRYISCATQTQNSSHIDFTGYKPTVAELKWQEERARKEAQELKQLQQLTDRMEQEKCQLFAKLDDLDRQDRQGGVQLEEWPCFAIWSQSSDTVRRGMRSECHRQNTNVWSATDLCVWGWGEHFLFWGLSQILSYDNRHDYVGTLSLGVIWVICDRVLGNGLLSLAFCPEIARTTMDQNRGSVSSHVSNKR